MTLKERLEWLGRMALLVFILPPDEPTLLQRLTDRGRDSDDDIQKRFRAAKREIHMAKGSRAFDYMVINDDLEKAVDAVASIVKACRCRRERARARAEEIIGGKGKDATWRE